MMKKCENRDYVERVHCCSRSSPRSLVIHNDTDTVRPGDGEDE